jgi:hypothetical protein
MAVIFCTACIDLDPQRYVDWISYYKGWADLLMVNDGEVTSPIDLRGVRLITFNKRLGRPRHLSMPGWKRSFHQGLTWCKSRYDKIAHVESDMYIKSKDKFLDYLNHPDHYSTGWCSMYNMPEAALQIINKPSAIAYLLRALRYYYDEAYVEHIVQRFRPNYILKGDRFEKGEEAVGADFDWLGQTDLKTFKRLLMKDS